ncbi:MULTISPECIES: lytic transglycosylase domain-containing protein [unclassified Sphingomonas]|uniref:lytic transglycosylase domain-containing protein n=1 Tax=unclassified Sphingomonas TaxID=196159 RepID=UPI0006FC4879|nr:MULTISPECIES: lytic transglycosylase domain-containing protein [unclassified Sphingomonas]KRB78796.1 type VI secretion protein [Sphingomonas sp. Root710]KRB93706.1 type VI secretion protein [Sphingomonas sp. Root720]
MIYDVPAITVLAHQCAPEIATEAVVPLVVTESGGDSLQINVNKGPRVRAGSVVEAAAIVRRYVAAGYTADVGLAQINSANFARLGVTVEQAFDPCTNLRLASLLLQQGYGLANRYYSGLDAISATYSLYNTGTLTRGFRNGYVGRVWMAASTMGSVQAVPPLPATGAASNGAAAAVVKPASERDPWIVGQVASNVIEVFK